MFGKDALEPAKSWSEGAWSEVDGVTHFFPPFLGWSSHLQAFSLRRNDI
jgi:hypothetical protein